MDNDDDDDGGEDGEQEVVEGNSNRFEELDTRHEGPQN